MIKVLATDLDGTLMYPAHLFRCIPRKNVKFIRKWIDSGNRLVLVTSRGPDFMRRLYSEIQRDFDYITYTSSYIVSDGKVIRDVSVDGNEMIQILDEMQTKYRPDAYLANVRGEPLLINDVSGVGKILRFVYVLYWFFQGRRREKYHLDNHYFREHMKNGAVYKVMVFFGMKKTSKEKTKEINKLMREEFPDVESSWSGIVNEITPKNCNKGAGLEYYCKYLNINPEDVYVVGDSGNDISMFNLFHENSYAMAKAYPSVKKYAKHVIHRVHHLDEIVFGKGE